MVLLSNHVRVAKINGSLIFLDLYKNLYSFLEEKDAVILIDLLNSRDYRYNSDRCINRYKDEEAQKLIAELRLNNLIVENDIGHSVTKIESHPELREQHRLIGIDRPNLKPEHLAKFLWSYLRARAFISLISLHYLTETLSKVRSKYFTKKHVNTAEIVEVYRMARPIFFRNQGNCLLDSVCMKFFLGLFGLKSELHIGVDLEPFRAHAWLQCGNVVVNDSVPNVSNYTLILVA